MCPKEPLCNHQGIIYDLGICCSHIYQRKVAFECRILFFKLKLEVSIDFEPNGIPFSSKSTGK